jgi:2',3'-cyclic-nucleotide 2'-phosphodiesterase/3'-nucleotidase
MISNLAFGRPVVEQMNALGYAAMAIGNHEFDWTADTLERRVHEMRFGALGANMTEARTGRRPRWARADTLLTRRGVRVGVLGLCYPRTPSVTLAAHVAHLRFGDDSAAATTRVPLLRRAQRADVVIGVGHIPATTFGGRAGGDLARLARGVPGVDLWLGGHSHNRVRDEVNGVPVLIAGSHGEVVALCDLRVDPVGNRVVERETRLVSVWADSLPPDSAMAARVARWNEGVAKIAAEPVGRNAVRLTRNREGESTVGSLTADAMRAAVAAEIAFQNSGGLRADLPEGVITRGGIYEVIPFDNTIVTMRLTGAEVKRVLEEGLRTGRVSQVSGIRYAFDPSRPAMERVITLTDGSGAPLDTGRAYSVATNNFMAGGGDDYATLARGADAKDTQILVRDALERHVRERTRGGAALELRLEGRITRRDGSPGSR